MNLLDEYCCRKIWKYVFEEALKDIRELKTKVYLNYSYMIRSSLFEYIEYEKRIDRRRLYKILFKPYIKYGMMMINDPHIILNYISIHELRTIYEKNTCENKGMMFNNKFYYKFI